MGSSLVQVFVLGIDPGVSRCGYAAVMGRGSDTTVRALGVLTTSPSDPLPTRLAQLGDELRGLVAEIGPDVVAIERVFFQVNVRTAMSVGQASGLAMAEAARAGCEVAHYSPNQVKTAVAGWGGADKSQVAKMVQSLLDLDEPPRPADAADAAALALCHLAHASTLARLAEAER